ncbi:MAG: hypothetical protein J5875_06425 [Paludibacteraceae bacterium]|nr:hypothetical protein [Paludibacteraceae bacterium]
MKRNILTLIVLCATLAVRAENKIVLKAEGKHTYTFVNESDASFKKSHHATQKQTIKYSIEPKKIDGKECVDFQYTAIKCERKRKDSTTVLDTEKPRLPLSHIMRQATNRGVKVELGQKHLTTGTVAGIDTIDAHLFDDFVTPPDSVKRVTYNYLINEEYGKNLVRSLIENALSVAPDSAVKDKGTWLKVTCRYGTFAGNSATQYTLKEKKGNTYTISGINTIDKTKPCRYSIGGIAYLLEEANGQIVSDLTLDSETGLLISSSTTISIKAKATPLSMNETTDESISDEIVLSIKQTIVKE